MIKEKNIEILITRRNKAYYKNKYNCNNINTKILIDIVDINHNAKNKITAICEICGTETILPINKYWENKNRGSFYSCKKCSIIKYKQTNINRYGVDNPMKSQKIKEKIKNNNIKKYGVTTTLLNLKTKEKIKKTIQNRYGVDNILSNKKIREKSKLTIIKKYGVDHYSKTKNFFTLTYTRWKNDAITKLKKYNINDFILTNNRLIKIKCNNCNKYYEINSKLLYSRYNEHITLCTICNPINSHISDKENKLYNFIKNNYNNNKIILSDRKILNGKELDIYLPDLKIAFEFNGLYWHNELHKDKNYHLKKTEDCLKKDIQLFHIWEDDWIYKNDIVKSMILNKLGKTKNKIYARKTEIKEVTDNKLIRNFLINNHLQGFVGSRVKIGLFYNDELVSLMTFGKKRLFMKSKSSNDEYELLRYCNKLNTNVIGGASKLFKYFIKTYKPKEITTYADRSHSQGKLYEKLGFKFIHKTSPNYYYIINKKREHRFNFKKDKLIREGYDKNMTEHDIMLSRDIYRIFDSGSLKYSINL